MRYEDCRVGMKVIFGRRNGERTLGVVVRRNPTKAKVQTLEARGVQRRTEAGEVWTVPYSMMEPAPDEAVAQPANATLVTIAPAEEPIKFSPADHIDNLILEAISCCYMQLSPENLSADGMLPRNEIVRRRAMLQRKLRGLFSAYGREVGEMASLDWVRERRIWLGKMQKEREERERVQG